MNPAIKSALYDLLTGIVLVFAVSIVGAVSNYQITLMTVILLFLLGGSLRANNRAGNIWLDLILINAPFLIVGIAFGLGNREILLMPAAALLSSFLGILSRSRWMSRSPIWRYAILGTSAAAVVFVGIAALSGLTGSYSSSDVNAPAPKFKITAPDGSILAADPKSSGKIIVIDFWASWCRPCQLEFPYIQRIYDKYKDNPGIEIVAVNSGSGDTMEKARSFMNDRSYTIPMAFDNGQLSELFKIEALPTLIIVDKKGAIRLRHLGFNPGEKLVETISAQIDKLLAE
jgi:thiol-disulfide isomerase/thioredoxin